MFIFKYVEDQRYKQWKRLGLTSHCGLLSSGRDVGSKGVVDQKSVIKRLRCLLGTLLNYLANSESPYAKVTPSNVCPHCCLLLSYFPLRFRSITFLPFLLSKVATLFLFLIWEMRSSLYNKKKKNEDPTKSKTGFIFQFYRNGHQAREKKKPKWLVPTFGKQWFFKSLILKNTFPFRLTLPGTIINMRN